VFAYLKELPPEDASEFPVGTITIKTVEIGPATDVEIAYDVLRLVRTEHQLLPFARLEMYDTQASVPDADDANPELDITS
jgi:hypothetical protein